MEALLARLRRHRTVRRLFPSKVDLDIDSDEGVMRQGLDIQRRASKALIGYANAVASAFEALFAAHAALEDSGLCDLEEAKPMADALIAGLKEARALVQEMAKVIVVPLEVHSTTLTACADDVARADKAAAELRRYSEKLEGMQEETDNCDSTMKLSEKAEARLARNRDKLQSVTHTTNVLQMRANDGLKACLLRRSHLVELAFGALGSTAEAFRLAFENVPAVTMAASPQASTAPTEACLPGEGPNPFANPFEMDVDASLIEVQPGPKLATALPILGREQRPPVDTLAHMKLQSGAPMKSPPCLAVSGEEFTTTAGSDNPFEQDIAADKDAFSLAPEWPLPKANGSPAARQPGPCPAYFVSMGVDRAHGQAKGACWPF